MLAHLLVSKYTDHLPLYRQSEIYAREGLDLDRSTLSDWVGQAVWLLQPIVDGIRRHVFAAEKIHGDALAEAFRCTIKRRKALSRFVTDGRSRGR